MGRIFLNGGGWFLGFDGIVVLRVDGRCFGNVEIWRPLSCGSPNITLRRLRAFVLILRFSPTTKLLLGPRVSGSVPPFLSRNPVLLRWTILRFLSFKFHYHHHHPQPRSLSYSVNFLHARTHACTRRDRPFFPPTSLSPPSFFFSPMTTLFTFPNSW